MAKEVKQYALLAREGAVELYNEARDAIAGREGGSEIAPRNTRFHLPVIYGLTGITVQTAEDGARALEIASSLIAPSPADEPWMPYLGTALDAGIAALISSEIITATSDKATAFIPDEWVVKKLGAWIDRRELKFVLAVGKPSGKEDEVLAEFEAKNVFLFTQGDWGNRDAGGGGSLGVASKTLNVGEDYSSMALAFGVLARMAILSGVRPGDHGALLEFCRRRLFGFIALFDDEVPAARALAAAGISFGLATITREYTPQLLPIYSVPRF